MGRAHARAHTHTGKKRSRLQRADYSDEEERPAAGDDAVAEEEEVRVEAERCARACAGHVDIGTCGWVGGWEGGGCGQWVGSKVHIQQ